MASILLVDDDSITNFISSKLISKTLLDTTITVCLNGREAIGMLHAMEKKGPTAYPDYILLDLNMPVMNGWEFLDEYLRLNLEPPGKCRIFILSSSISSADIARAHSYPIVSDFVSKPLDAKKVQELFMSEINE